MLIFMGCLVVVTPVRCSRNDSRSSLNCGHRKDVWESITVWECFQDVGEGWEEQEVCEMLWTKGQEAGLVLVREGSCTEPRPRSWGALRAASCRSLMGSFGCWHFLWHVNKNQRCNSSDCTRRWKHSLIRHVYALGVLGAVAFEFM